MTDPEVLAGIEDVARQHLALDRPLRRDMRLVRELKLDSLRMLTLVVELENRFRIRLDDEDPATIETVGDLVAAIRRRV